MTARKELSQAIRNPWLRVAALLCLLAVAATAALGGFDRAGAGTAASQIPAFGAGIRLDTGAMRLTALQAWRSLRDPDGISDPAASRQYLVLRVRVDNRSGRTISPYGDLQQDVVWLRDGGTTEVKADRFLREDDHTLVDALHPELPLVVDMVWEVPAGEALPAQLEWGVLTRAFSPKATFFGASGWVQGRPLARLALPVADRRAEVIAP